METWIALLRGINVGGKNSLPMQDLRSLLEGLGYQDVKTYIQSGNVVFRSGETSADALSIAIRDAISERFGFAPHIIVLPLEALKTALTDDPYGASAEDKRHVHFFFLAEGAKAADIAKLQALSAASEAFTLTPSVFYLHAPDGIGRSKLAAQAETCLGVATTARNLKSVEAILALAH
ncbi:DUF1697 domain-containing protein [uncultured Cohaesibacter sp.]|uniref:DUF1697 domain-containing protein n=1 Tax=uncultured Cohaesibacter sp. TaxID=1002546 RepID=UPI0029C5FF00|nr:DUF1697 domain-containing protein [uncultured Cohaesibacter sp.]